MHYIPKLHRLLRLYTFSRVSDILKGIKEISKFTFYTKVWTRRLLVQRPQTEE